MSGGRITYRFLRGASIKLGLQATEGDPLILTQRKADLKRAALGPSVPPPSEPVAASFVITARAAVILPKPIAAGFDLTLPDDVVRGLPAGIYVVTPAFGAGEDVWEIAAPLFIAIDEVTTDRVTP